MNVEQRDGKEYMAISDMSVSTEVSSFSMNMQYQNVASFLSDMKNQVVNSSWKVFKLILNPFINTFVVDVIQSTISPILEQLALQDLFNMS